MRKYRMTLLTLFVAVLAVLLLAPTGAQAQDPDFLVDLDDPMAAFLESRAYAARMGATDEFRKMEWVALDEANNKLYLAMSEINRGMSDDEGDITLPENNCGIVYEADLDADYNISALNPLLVGGPFNPDAEDGNRCALDNIANPDSLFVDAAGNLWIGEDTGNHVNNFIWKWDGESLHRFGATPLEAEATGVYATEAGDMFVSVQHPSSMNTYPFNRATLVAITGFNALTDSFEDLPVPEGDAQKTLALAAGDFQVLARVGEEIPHDAAGQRWGQVDLINGQLDLMCNQPDGNVFLPTNEEGSEGYLYTNYECQPGTVGKLYMRKNDDGWEILEGENVDFSPVGLTWNNCGSSRTPWNTVLTSEEYEPIATQADWRLNVDHMNDNLGTQANPYDYGWLVEVYPDDGGNYITTQVVKRYALGRFSHENAMVMPDGKTVYHGDDGTDTVFFKSVSDEAGDLSSTTLYAAKVTQNPDESLALEWIELGSANDDDIYDAIRSIELTEETDGTMREDERRG